MTSDPLGIFSADLTDPQTLNQYSYVRNNPLSMIDPTGMDDIGIGCDDYTCGDCFILCDVGISWGGGSSGPTSVWVPPDTAGTSSPGGSSTGGPDPNNPFSGETFGIPNGMRIPGMTLAEIFGLPNSPGLILDATDNASTSATSWLSNVVYDLGTLFQRMPTMGPRKPKRSRPEIPQKVTTACMTAALIQNFLGDDAHAGVTTAANIGAAIALGLVKQSSPVLLPGPGWLYVGTAAVWDVGMTAKSYADCRNGGPSFE